MRTKAKAAPKAAPPPKRREATPPSPEFCEWFFVELGSTPDTLKEILARTPAEFGTVSMSRIQQWRQRFPEFLKQYKDAREFKGDLCLDEAQHVADMPAVGQIITEGKRGDKNETIVKTIDNVERSKLRVSVLIQRAKAFNPALQDRVNVGTEVIGSLAERIASARARKRSV